MTTNQQKKPTTRLLGCLKKKKKNTSRRHQNEPLEDFLIFLCFWWLFVGLRFIMLHSPFKSTSNQFNTTTPCCLFSLKLVKHRWRGVMLRYFQQRYNGVKQSGELGGVLLNSQGWIHLRRIRLSIFHFQSVIEKRLIAMHKKRWWCSWSLSASAVWIRGDVKLNVEQNYNFS